MSKESQVDQRALELAVGLIKFPSTKENPVARSEALEYASKRLDGFRREKFEKNGVRSDLYYNTSERPQEFRILLHAHLDVVPAQNQKQYEPFIKSGKLFGRGASDMKSGASVMIEVFRDMAKDLNYPIALSLTTDEEVGGFNGAGYQVQEGVRSTFVISGESTDYKIGNQHKGVLLLELKSAQKGGHTAYDGDPHNALLRVIRVQTKATEMYPGPDGTWRTTCAPTKTSTSNLAHNVVPSDATGELAFRWIAQDNPDDIEDKIKEIDKQVEVTRGPFGMAHYTPEQNTDIELLTKVIAEVTGDNAIFQPHAGASDVRHWTEKGSGGIDFGLIGVGLHTENEYAEIKSFAVYANLLKSFLLGVKNL